jgi:hypothetical protein
MSDDESYASGSTEDAPEYEVERILAESVFDGKTVYLVKWLNYDDEQCTWNQQRVFRWMKYWMIGSWRLHLMIRWTKNSLQVSNLVWTLFRKPKKSSNWQKNRSCLRKHQGKDLEILPRSLRNILLQNDCARLHRSRPSDSPPQH